MAVVTVPRAARRVTPAQVTDAVLAGSWVIDLREHDPREHGWAGWLVPWDDGIVLLVDSPDVREPALRRLTLIGLDGTDAPDVTDAPAATRRRADWAAYREARALSVAAGTRPPVVIDVRPHDDWVDGHLPGALHLQVHEVEVASGRIPPGELWVHCRSGHRAGIVADLLHRAGRDVVHVDDFWDRVGELHLPTTAAA